MQINTIFHWLINWIWKTLFLLVPFLMTILTLGCSNKPVEKEMKMPMLFHNRGPAEKEVYKLGCEGAYQMGKNGCLAVCTNTGIKKSV